MSKTKFELNKSGVRDLLRSTEMQEVCKSYATAAQSRLGDGYEVTVFVGKNRTNAMIAAESAIARSEAMSNNSILKALR